MTAEINVFLFSVLAEILSMTQRKTVPQLRASRSNDCSPTRQTDNKLVGSWQAKSTLRRHVSNAAQPIRQVYRCAESPQTCKELSRRRPPVRTHFAWEHVTSGNWQECLWYELSRSISNFAFGSSERSRLIMKSLTLKIASWKVASTSSAVDIFSK